jgi:hypothetical protein
MPLIRTKARDLFKGKIWTGRYHEIVIRYFSRRGDDFGCISV